VCTHCLPAPCIAPPQESHLSNTSAKFYGEITQQMLKNSAFPGSNNGTGLFQTIVGLKCREVYERITEVSPWLTAVL
jgi:phosphoribulokinase